MKILQVSGSSSGGGAHKIAAALRAGFRERGHESWMAVAKRAADEPDVFEIPSGVSDAQRAVLNVGAIALEPGVGRVPGVRRAQQALRAPDPLAYAKARWRGREYFDYPGSRELLDLPPSRPDIVHLHNLHGEYFDLRALAAFSRDVPIAMTLHDEWSYTGHCAYGLGCERWRIGCGSCPDLTIYPSVRRDATHENWLAKRAIYEDSRLYVSAPSRWLLDQARDSILATGAGDFRHIPNGVDHEVFRPAEQGRARELLGLPREPLMLLFTANAVRFNKFKDYRTVAAAAERVAAGLPGRPLLMVALGGAGEAEVFENGELRFVPYETEPVRVAAYYQAADLYLHAANADTFPTTILEALSVGLPVVATAVGGIPEQVRSLGGAPGAWHGEAVDAASATGVLVAPHDAAGMAEAAAHLLADAALRRRVSMNAAADAAERFGLERQLDATLAWYAESIADWRAWRGTIE